MRWTRLWKAKLKGERCIWAFGSRNALAVGRVSLHVRGRQCSDAWRESAKVTSLGILNDLASSLWSIVS